MLHHITDHDSFFILSSYISLVLDMGLVGIAPTCLELFQVSMLSCFHPPILSFRFIFLCQGGYLLYSFQSSFFFCHQSYPLSPAHLTFFSSVFSASLLGRMQPRHSSSFCMLDMTGYWARFMAFLFCFIARSVYQISKRRAWHAMTSL